MPRSAPLGRKLLRRETTERSRTNKAGCSRAAATASVDSNCPWVGHHPEHGWAKPAYRPIGERTRGRAAHRQFGPLCEWDRPASREWQGETVTRESGTVDHWWGSSPTQARSLNWQPEMVAQPKHPVCRSPSLRRQTHQLARAGAKSAMAAGPHNAVSARGAVNCQYSVAWAVATSRASNAYAPT